MTSHQTAAVRLILSGWVKKAGFISGVKLSKLQLAQRWNVWEIKIKLDYCTRQWRCHTAEEEQTWHWKKKGVIICLKTEWKAVEMASPVNLLVLKAYWWWSRPRISHQIWTQRWRRVDWWLPGHENTSTTKQTSGSATLNGDKVI